MADQMGRIAWGPNRDKERGLIAAFTSVDVFYDASGSQADPTGAVTVVGAISNERKWNRFEREWSDHLSQHGVDSLHMTDFVHSKKCFDGWDGPEQAADRAAFIDGLIAITKRGVLKCFSLSLLLSDYREVDAEYRISEEFGYGHPKAGAYAVCSGSCMSHVSAWVRLKYSHAGIAHVHERGDTGRGALMRYLDRENIPGTVAFKRKKEDGRFVRQFEAADFIAWEHRRRIIEVENTSPPDARESLRRLVTMVPFKALYHDAESLRRACESKPTLFPRRTDGEATT